MAVNIYAKVFLLFFFLFYSKKYNVQLITNSALATAKAEFTILFRAVRLKYPNRKKLLEATRPEPTVTGA